MSGRRHWARIERSARSLIAAIEARDIYTAGHSMRVTAYALAIAAAAGGIDLVRLQLATQLHDVGKIGVPDIVLNKPGRLTDEEFAQVRLHPGLGVHIIERSIDDLLVLGVVRHHHERWDGRGYPDGLAGEQIPIEARIVAIADTIDAMTHDRAYRGRLTWAETVAEVRRCRGTQFCPVAVDAFEAQLALLAELHAGFTAAVPG